MARKESIVSSTVIFLICSFSNERQVKAGSGNEWGYVGNIGPDQWHIDYPQCAGVKQSPISIDTAKAVLNLNLTEFKFNGYQEVKDVNMTLQNNGHSVQVDLLGNNMNVSKGDLPGTYRAKQFHFHWGSVDKRGSEHDINGQLFPMEMHVVHFNEKYPTFKDASNETDGLLVLAFLFEIGDDNPEFDKIISHFYQIAHKDDLVSIQTFPLGSLFPKDLSTYYRYSGSLTTPPCSESVIWTIFKSTVKISENQLNRFRYNVYRNYVNETDRNISDDFRPSQPLNQRKVYASHSDAIYEYESKSSILYTSLPVLILCVVIAKLSNFVI